VSLASPVDLEALEAKLAKDVDVNNGRHFCMSLVERATLLDLIGEVRQLRAAKERLLVTSVRLTGDKRLGDALAKSLEVDA